MSFSSENKNFRKIKTKKLGKRKRERRTETYNHHQMKIKRSGRKKSSADDVSWCEKSDGDFSCCPSARLFLCDCLGVCVCVGVGDGGGGGETNPMMMHPMRRRTTTRRLRRRMKPPLRRQILGKIRPTYTTWYRWLCFVAFYFIFLYRINCFKYFFLLLSIQIKLDLWYPI